jgi:hypothetical protein
VQIQKYPTTNNTQIKATTNNVEQEAITQLQATILTNPKKKHKLASSNNSHKLEKKP